MNDILQQIERFHGHLGPYAVIGYRMGLLANKHLGTTPFSKQVTLWTGTAPPLSCIIDGVQLSSGCTLGTGKITVHQENLPKAQFINTKGQQIEILLKPEIQQEIDTTVTEDNIIDYACKTYEKSDSELFELKKL